MRASVLAWFVVAGAAGCARFKTPCVEIGRCFKEGDVCTPAPIGSGWSHALQCDKGKWAEIEIAPLPQPVPGGAGSPVTCVEKAACSEAGRMCTIGPSGPLAHPLKCTEGAWTALASPPTPDAGAAPGMTR